MSSSITSDVAISVSNLTKKYRLYRKPLHRFLDLYGLLPNASRKCTEHLAVDGLSFEIGRGEKVAIIGRNGAGKSTLLKMICGVVAPSSGSIKVAGEVHALLSLGTGFHPDFTGRENVYSYLAHLGITGKEADRHFRAIVEFSELHEYIDQPVKTYSAGMGVRLMFSAATVIKPDILVIDEVLGAGDAYFSKKSFERMKELCEAEGTTLLMVTHDLYSAVTFCERLIWIDRGRVKMDGPGKAVLRAYEESIREQEDQRLRANRLAAIQANMATADDRRPVPVLPAYIHPIGDDGQPPAFAVSHLTLLDGEKEIARIDVADPGAPDATPLPPLSLILDSQEGNWGDVETIDGRQARRMLPYGSIFHKLPLLISGTDIAAAMEAGRLVVEVGCRAERPQTLNFVVLDDRGEPRRSALLPAETGGWTDLRAVLAPPESKDGVPAEGDHEASLRHGQRSIEITDVRFLDRHGCERMHVGVGSEMHVRLSYRINDPSIHERPTIVVAFQQNGLVRTHRFWTDKILLSAKNAREGTIEIVASPLLLGAGTYFITVAIYQEGYLTSQGPKKFFTASDKVYDMHARAYEIVVKPSTVEPLCNDVIFQHPSRWWLDGELVAESLPHADENRSSPMEVTGD
jgi:ABC-type polysaccharide/polyol phosphate transport system ATPase subunit